MGCSPPTKSLPPTTAGKPGSLRGPVRVTGIEDGTEASRRRRVLRPSGQVPVFDHSSTENRR